MMRGVGAPRYGGGMHHGVGGRHGGGGLSCRTLLPWFVAFHLVASFYVFNFLAPRPAPAGGSGGIGSDRSAVAFPTMGDASREQISQLKAQLSLARETIESLARRGAEAAGGAPSEWGGGVRHPAKFAKRDDGSSGGQQRGQRNGGGSVDGIDRNGRGEGGDARHDRSRVDRSGSGHHHNQHVDDLSGHRHREIGDGLSAYEVKEHALVWNYQTTGEPLEMKETNAILREPEGGYRARPFFSIVMAAYNQGKFIDETVKSVVSQSYERWELIIVNDGSKDDSWQRANALMEKYPKRRIRILNKRNGGLADARNVGLRYVKGTWLCMLDSDDLLGRDYLHRAADLIEEDGDVDIIPGCMRNFDAVSSDWCFPEGFSIVGISHWNKFHASVLVNRRLMEKVGGYDPAIPWGLEDWNFWLRGSVHNPIVRFVPEITFFYRHHQGTSMRKKMFALYLEQTKAMVRTNSVELYEPVQLLADHELIEEMHPDTMKALEEKMHKFPLQPMPYFWRSLARTRAMQYEEAIEDLQMALNLTSGKNARLSWQFNYRLALLYEALEELPEAQEAIDKAFHHVYFNEILVVKQRIEAALKGKAVLSGHAMLATPSYWSSDAEQREIRDGTLAGKLMLHQKMQKSMAEVTAQQDRMMALLSVATTHPCPPTRGGKRPDLGEVNLVNNPHFEANKDYWNPFGKGFEVDAAPSRSGSDAVLSAMMRNTNEDEASGAMQVIHLRQEVAAPVLLKAWSKATKVGGVKDGGYSLYVDINYVDDSHDWGFSLPFNVGTHGWEAVTAYLDKDKPIASLDVYCMFRGHEGSVLFDDVVVSEAVKAQCTCRDGEHYDPSPGRQCAPCPKGKKCMLSSSFDPALRM